jgi:hypothetical protein
VKEVLVVLDWYVNDADMELFKLLSIVRTDGVNSTPGILASGVIVIAPTGPAGGGAVMTTGADIAPNGTAAAGAVATNEYAVTVAVRGVAYKSGMV